MLLITLFQDVSQGVTPTDQEWLTLDFIKTFSGVSFVLYMFANTYQKFFNKKPLVLAILLALLLTTLALTDLNFNNFKWNLIALVPINAIFVFGSAFGITQFSELTAGSDPVALAGDGQKPKRRFTTSWFK